MKNHNFYSDKDYPSLKQKQHIWKNIERELPSKKTSNVHVHWRSFWIGSAAAILLIFAGIGMYNTVINMRPAAASVDQQMYETLSTATKQLRDLTPLLIQEAQEQNRPSIESTANAIEEIDRLIDEIKTDISINGPSPTKESSLKRLYATKLDFYKELLLNQEEQS